MQLKDAFSDGNGCRYTTYEQHLLVDNPVA
jgi:hypothetical protein